MFPWEAKKLKKGDRVLWLSPSGRVDGTVVRKRYSLVWIRWDSDEYDVEYNVNNIPQIHTQAQLDAEENNRKVIEALKAWNQEKLKQPPQEWH